MKDSIFYKKSQQLWVHTLEDFCGGTVESDLSEYGLCVFKGTAFNKQEFLELTSKCGTPVNQSSEGCKVFEVKNEGYQPGHPKFRGPSSNRELSFHTDRCDVIVFHCVRQAQSGGENLFVNVVALYEILEREAPELLKVLEGNFPYKRHNADPAHPFPYYELPVFAKEKELCLTLMTYLIHNADARNPRPSLL